MEWTVKRDAMETNYDVSNLKVELEIANETSKKYQKEITNLLNQLRKTKVEANNANNLNEENQNKIDEMIQIAKENQKKITFGMKILKEMNGSIEKEYESEIKNLRLKLEERETKMKMMEEELGAQYKIKIEQLELDLKEKESASFDLKEFNGLLRTKFNEEKNNLNAELNKWERKFHIISDESNSLKAEKKDFDLKLTTAKKELTIANQEIERLVLESVDSETQYKKLTEVLTGQCEDATHVKIIQKQKIEELTNKLEEVLKELKLLGDVKIQLSEANEEKNQLLAIKTMFEEHNQALRKLNKTFSTKLETQAVKLTEGFNISQKEIRERNEYLEKNLEKKVREYEIKREHHEKTLIEKLQEHQDAMRAKDEESKLEKVRESEMKDKQHIETLKKLQEHRNAIQANNEYLENKLEKFRGSEMKHKQDKKTLIETLQEHQNTLTTYDAQMEFVTDKVSKSQSQVGLHNALVKKLEARIDKYQEMIEEMKTKNKEFEENLKLKKKSLGGNQNFKNQKINKLKKQNILLKNVQKDLINQIEEMKTKSKGIGTNLKLKMGSLNENQNFKNDKIRELEKQEIDLTCQQFETNLKLTMENEEQNLKKIEEMKIKYKEFETNLKLKMENEKQNFKNEKIKELEKQNILFKNVEKDLNNQIEKMKTKNKEIGTNLKLKMGSLNENQNLKNKKIRELEAENFLLKKVKADLTHQIHDNQVKNNKLIELKNIYEGQKKLLEKEKLKTNLLENEKIKYLETFEPKNLKEEKIQKLTSICRKMVGKIAEFQKNVERLESVILKKTEKIKNLQCQLQNEGKNIIAKNNYNDNKYSKNGHIEAACRRLVKEIVDIDIYNHNNNVDIALKFEQYAIEAENYVKTLF